jgi:hypothetical protein
LGRLFVQHKEYREKGWELASGKHDEAVTAWAKKLLQRPYVDQVRAVMCSVVVLH